MEKVDKVIKFMLMYDFGSDQFQILYEFKYDQECTGVELNYFYQEFDNDDSYEDSNSY